jgi:hypothetical protein
LMIRLGLPRQVGAWLGRRIRRGSWLFAKLSLLLRPVISRGVEIFGYAGDAGQPSTIKQVIE